MKKTFPILGFALSLLLCANIAVGCTMVAACRNLAQQVQENTAALSQQAPPAAVSGAPGNGASLVLSESDMDLKRREQERMAQEQAEIDAAIAEMGRMVSEMHPDTGAE